MKRICYVFILLLSFSGLYAQEATTTSDDNKVFTFVQQQPVFAGDVNQWLAAHITYPADAIKNNIEGTVYVSFVIEKDGSITSVKVIRGINTLLDNESLRVIGIMPKWTPGRQNGNLVRVQYMIPIHFILNTSTTPEQKN